MKYKNIAFIPVRGGSKSIPLKNIKKLLERPLVYWVLDASVNCSYIDKVFVSTDSDMIKKTVEEYGCTKIEVVNRSEYTVEDNSSTESAMLEFANNYDFENIVLIQATSPLLQSKDLDRGFEKFLNHNYDSVLSGVTQKRFIWTSKGGNIFIPQNYNPFNRPRRQEFEGYFVENGAFYITEKKLLLNSKCRISGNIGISGMNEDSYFEIDEPSDWVIAESLLRKRIKTENNFNNILKNIKMLITDSDGVLTDGGMYYSERGDELKKFNARDGMAFQLLREKGVKIIIITGEDIDIVKKRAKKLEADEVYLGIKNKIDVIKAISVKYNIEFNEMAYIGDDINDLEAIKNVGFGCCVADGMENVKEASKYVTKTKGGHGAVREIAELIIEYK
ncbi:MAG: acylneuraminate cytidylyltransferase [Clostridium sp.]|jgi:N-acylneuraminate cytidylyltransferase|uniref:acylneuraminate cytidylyltransferase n=1 Tax=Clostridium sp. TaxID=1506 RepID=UPI0025B8EC27|nr:acylneuraminate cytidylyltransferase [Clostridium sp.]MCH3964315.1 acylneuraminate cytidylyltransferase [Clostridium sp.]MCI1715490.1 acylneuraminate cytidylyltransferase [Clostridium sp.]MCI1799718.1 acylneuraminate cytidylyltransferase [Clostridium sp.]MCI1813674.1 acylneuraminate cytidylyltransferase [Clostridium sp.]MCI1870531.1 acylneuraminate cytidylyltransferase [Clostridium sp.]